MGLFRSWRRRKLLAQPFPAEWPAILERNVMHYQYLSAEERGRLHDLLRVFIAEKYWEGCQGLEVTEEMRVTVAAQACLLVLEISGEPYRGVRTILIYPDAYVAQDSRQQSGVVTEGASGRLGEAHFRGPVVLSWADALNGGMRGDDGRNLVFHEFAHKLDMLDGSVNGTPPLEAHSKAATQDLYRRWGEVMTHEYEQLQFAIEHGRRTIIDRYGATNPAEFFAVTTEHFFEQPAVLRRYHCDLYDLLVEYYHQDWAERFSRP